MIEDIKHNISVHPWTFAKTMASIPHEYTVRKQWESEADFEDFVVYIRENGYAEQFYSKTFIYLNIDGYKYWTMGASVYETTIINRAKI